MDEEEQVRDEPTIVDRLAGAMSYIIRGQRCSHCREAESKRGYPYCTVCHATTALLSEAIKLGVLTKRKRHIVWKACEGSLEKTKTLRIRITRLVRKGS